MGATTSRRAILAAALVLLPSRALAGAANIPCSAPMVFSGAAVNVVVLPFSVPPELESATGDVGAQLAGLVQQEVLLAIAKFGSVGTVQLVGSRSDCTPEIVLAKLLGEERGAEEVLKPGRGLVLVWGRVFRSGDTLLLQSFVRFLRHSTDESLEAKIDGRPFTARLSAQAFACVPRRVSMSDLQSVREQFARARIIHDEPDENSSGHAIPQGDPFPYWVQAASGNWLRIESRLGRPGWILARVDQAGWSLRSRMPELSFVEGVTGYLRYRVGALQPQPGEAAAQVPGDRPGVGVLDAAASAIAAYQREWRTGAVLVDTEGAGSSAAGAQPLAISVPAQVSAFLTLLRPQPTGAALQEAIRRLDRASALLPHSAEVRNLSVLLRLRVAYGSQSDTPAAMPLFRELQAALSAEPTNRAALGNLASLCRLLLEPPTVSPPRVAALTADERDEVQRQLVALQAVEG